MVVIGLVLLLLPVTCGLATSNPNERDKRSLALTDSTEVPKNWSLNFSDKYELYLLVMAPFPIKDFVHLWDGGRALIPAARLAVEEINQAGLLGSYNISTIEINSGCSLYGDVATVEYIKTVYHGSYRRDLLFGAVGPACTDTDFIIEDLGNKNPLIQVTVATSHQLRNNKRFPHVFSTISSSKRFSEAIVELVLYHKWSKIGVILEGTDLFVELFNLLSEDLKRRVNIDVLLFSVTQVQFPLKAILESQYRVMVVLATYRVIEKLLCEAYKYGDQFKIAYPTYQWILVERTNYTYTPGLTNCDLKQTLAAFSHSILMEYILQSPSNKTLVSNRTFMEYFKAYKAKVDEYEAELNISILPELSSAIPYAHLYYDAVWAIGLALANVTKQWDISDCVNRGLTLHDVNFVQKLKQAMYAQEPFNGASGQIRFQNTTGDSPTAIKFNQVIGPLLVSAGKLTSDNQLTLNGTFIEDSFHYEQQFIGMPTPVVIVVLTALISVLALTIFFQVIYIANRNDKNIRASSPKLNQIMFCGCYMMELSIALYVITETVQLGGKDSYGTMLCYLYWSALELGWGVIITTILVRTWRIYRIFVHFMKPGGWMLTDAALFCFSLILLIPVLLNILFTAFDPIKLEIAEHLDLNNISYITKEHEEMCIRPLWHIAVNFLYNLTLLVCSLVMAIICRKIISRYRIVKSISILIYSKVFIVFFGSALIYLADILIWPIIVRNMIFCIANLSLTLVCILFIFFPPTIPMLKRLWKYQRLIPELPSKSEKFIAL